MKAETMLIGTRQASSLQENLDLVVGTGPALSSPAQTLPWLQAPYVALCEVRKPRAHRGSRTLRYLARIADAQ